MGAVAEGGRRLTNPLYSSLFNIYKKWDYKAIYTRLYRVDYCSFNFPLKLIISPKSF
jgi:hypothetical protein